MTNSLQLPGEDDAALEKLATAAPDVLGGIAGAGVGLAVGGPPGAIVGAGMGPAVAHTLRKVGTEISRRFLSPRETSRVGALFLLVAGETKARLDAGEQQRTDEFFDETEGRSNAEEIADGVFLAAQREYEERKLPYLASLLAGFVFDPAINRAHAVALLRFAQSLSYRQLCLIAFYAQIVPNTQIARLATPVEHRNGAGAMLLTEVAELASRNVLIVSATVDGGLSLFGETDPGALTETGVELYELMRLNRIPSSELDDLLDIFRRCTPADQDAQ